MDDANLDKTINLAHSALAMALIGKMLDTACKIKEAGFCDKEYIKVLTQFVIASSRESGRIAAASGLVDEDAINRMSTLLEKFEKKEKS